MLKDNQPTPIIASMLNLPLARHLVMTLAAVFATVISLGQFYKYYALSRHPVPITTEQLSFDAQEIKSYYAHMIAEGTLSFFRQAQIVDYAYMVSACAASVFLGTLFARLNKPGGTGFRLALISPALVLAGSLCDAIENLWSFAMLLNPTGFSSWLAWPYSTFASLKFLCVGLGILCLLGSFIASVVRRLHANQPPP